MAVKFETGAFISRLLPKIQVFPARKIQVCRLSAIYTFLKASFLETKKKAGIYAIRREINAPECTRCINFPPREINAPRAGFPCTKECTRREINGKPVPGGIPTSAGMAVKFETGAFISRLLPKIQVFPARKIQVCRLSAIY